MPAFQALPYGTHRTRDHSPENVFPQVLLGFAVGEDHDLEEEDVEHTTVDSPNNDHLAHHLDSHPAHFGSMVKHASLSSLRRPISLFKSMGGRT